ncbi:MAG TPA: histidine kinase dimerization/phospho-acceptor domain-containing protein [Anaerolineales bacterium]|nr:histidine kinase dimerization/phospho-acceptor domain-containing protein [Anaerolineales bacterium]
MKSIVPVIPANPQAKRAYLSFLHYQLRTPLAQIIGLSELLQYDVRSIGCGCETVANDLDYINQAGQQVASIITDLLQQAEMEIDE